MIEYDIHDAIAWNIAMFCPPFDYRAIAKRLREEYSIIEMQNKHDAIVALEDLRERCAKICDERSYVLPERSLNADEELRNASGAIRALPLEVEA